MAIEVKEAVYTNPNGSQPKAPINTLPIKNYLVMIDDDGGESKKTDYIEFRNMEKYGWIGIYAMSFEEGENKLKNSIEQQLGTGGKAEVVILSTHGGFINNSPEQLAVYSDFNKKEYIQTQSLLFHNLKVDPDKMTREQEEVLLMSEEQKKLSQERKQRAVERAKRAESRSERAKYRDSKADKRKQSDKDNERYEDLFEEGNDNNDKILDDARENELIQSMNNEKAWIKRNVYNNDIKRNIEYLLNIINYVDDNKKFILAACRSAAYDSFLENVAMLTKNRVDIYGFSGYAVFSYMNKADLDHKTTSEIGEPAPENVGVLDADIYINEKNQKKPYSINSPNENGKVKGFLANQKNGPPSVYNNIVIVKNGIEIK